VKSVLSEELLDDLPRPWLVIEDAHVNLIEVLERLHDVLEPGDYLVVEDTCAKEKYEVFSVFASGHDDDYFVDTHYTDNFGYNATFNWNSFLRRG
jgi:cephalosporin hydroxylase